MAKDLKGKGYSMRIEYDTRRDLVYIWFGDEEAKAAETVTIKPGVYADFDREGELIGIEILDASDIIGKKIELALPDKAAA